MVLAGGFFRNFVHENAEWDPGSFDVTRDGALAEKKLAYAIDAVDAHLERFLTHGGKLILFEGWSDPIISPTGVIHYYAAVRTAVGARAADAGVRLFMLPGMGHCNRGPGPNRFGQSAAGAGDPEAKIGAALQRWVETGKPPERLIATKHEDDSDERSRVIRTRPACAYPKQAIYRGHGSRDEAAGFECRYGVR